MKVWIKHVLLCLLVVAVLMSTTACSKGTPNYAHLLNPMSGGADAEAEALRQNVLNAADEL